MVRDRADTASYRPDALLPTDWDQGRRDIDDAALRREQVILRRRVPRVEGLDAYPEAADRLFRLGAQRSHLRPYAEHEQVCKCTSSAALNSFPGLCCRGQTWPRPEDREQPERFGGDLELAARVDQTERTLYGVVAVVVGSLPWPPRKRLAADEEHAGTIDDAHARVEREAGRQAGVDGGRRRRRLAEDVELAKVGLRWLVRHGLVVVPDGDGAAAAGGKCVQRVAGWGG